MEMKMKWKCDEWNRVFIDNLDDDHSVRTVWHRHSETISETISKTQQSSNINMDLLLSHYFYIIFIFVYFRFIIIIIIISITIINHIFL